MRHRKRSESVAGGCSDPLYTAVWEGNVPAVKNLLAGGQDPNCRGEMGARPLHYAAWNGFRDIVQLLVDGGADVNVRDDAGLSPLHHAIRNGHHDVEGLLESRGAALSLIEAVALDAHGLVSRKLQEDPSSANERNGDGETPLFYCSSRRMAELLLAGGADVNARDNEGLTPLHAAAMMGYRDVAEVLLVNGADISARAKSGATPLYEAWVSDEMDTCRLLVGRGARIEGDPEMVAALRDVGGSSRGHQ